MNNKVEKIAGEGYSSLALFFSSELEMPEKS